MTLTTNQNSTPSPLPDLWGTSISQGLRVGPSAYNQGCPLPVLAANLRYSDSQIQDAENRRQALDQWGPGIYTGGLFTYRILPTAFPITTASVAPTALGRANIVYSENLVGRAFEFLPLASLPGAPRATQLVTRVDGSTVLVLDYPRTVNIYSDASQTCSYEFNIYGTDMYGQKMMETITYVNAAPGAAGDVYYVTGKKAFSQITAVYFVGESGGELPGLPISIGTSNVFGLPFALNQACHVIGYSQGDVKLQALSMNDYKEGSFTVPIAQFTATTLQPYLNAGPGLIRGGLADPLVPSTATTRDVRGVFAPYQALGWTNVTYSQAAGFTITGPDVATTTGWTGGAGFQSLLTITYYVAGADMYQNQIDAQIEFTKNSVADPTIFEDMWATLTPARDQDGMKGIPQYWEEPPAA
jgi:hypothetical protein